MKSLSLRKRREKVPKYTSPNETVQLFPDGKVGAIINGEIQVYEIGKIKDGKIIPTAPTKGLWDNE